MEGRKRKQRGKGGEVDVEPVAGEELVRHLLLLEGSMVLVALDRRKLST
jgi:hypothetical protein